MNLPASNTMSREAIAAFVCSDDGAAIVQAVSEEMSQEAANLHGGGLGGAARLSTGGPIARTILAEIGNMQLDAAIECTAEICKTGANVILLGRHEDLASYRALRAAGAFEYFAFPISTQELLGAIARADAPVAPVAQLVTEADVRQPKRIAVMGCNGGVGSSLLAQNLAFWAASAKGPNLKTALVDADLRFGSQAIDLDRKDTPGLHEALSAPGRVDPTFLSATMEPINNQLSLYSQQMHLTQSTEPVEGAFGELMVSMGDAFDATILDLPRSTFISHPEIAKSLDTLVLVLPAGYAGVSTCSRIMSLVQSEAPDLKVLPVLSRLRLDAKLSVKDINSTLEGEVAAVLPESGKVIQRAHNAAKPVIEVQPRSAYAKVCRDLWSKIATQQSVSAPKPSRRLFKRAAA